MAGKWFRNWVIPGQVITKNGRTPSDFNETWYMHTLSEVIKPHPFLASYVIWLLSYNFSKILVFGKFSVNQWYLIGHNLWTDCFWQLQIIPSCLFWVALSDDIFQGRRSPIWGQRSPRMRFNLIKFKNGFLFFGHLLLNYSSFIIAEVV